MIAGTCRHREQFVYAVEPHFFGKRRIGHSGVPNRVEVSVGVAVDKVGQLARSVLVTVGIELAHVTDKGNTRTFCHVDKILSRFE